LALAAKPQKSDAATIRTSVNKSDPWNIQYEELLIKEEVGRGGFGVVYHGSWRSSPVAVKQMSSEYMTLKDIDDFNAEISLMKNIRPHANVLMLLGICQHPLCIVTEFMTFGSLNAFLQTEAAITPELVEKIVKGIARGMLHLHLEHIVHRDLAARNVLLTRGLEPKISDFGLSRANVEDNGNTTKSTVGPLKWMAPECIRDSVYGTKSDVWSFGITVIEILTRQPPFPGIDQLQVAAKVASRELQPQIPSNASPRYAKLLQTCFAFSPEDRPAFTTICAGLEKD